MNVYVLEGSEKIRSSHNVGYAGSYVGKRKSGTELDQLIATIKTNGTVFSEFFNKYNGANEIDIGSGLFIFGGSKGIAIALTLFSDDTFFYTRAKPFNFHPNIHPVNNLGNSMRKTPATQPIASGEFAPLQQISIKLQRTTYGFSKNKFVIELFPPPNVGTSYNRITVKQIRELLITLPSAIMQHTIEKLF